MFGLPFRPPAAALVDGASEDCAKATNESTRVLARFTTDDGKGVKDGTTAINEHRLVSGGPRVEWSADAARLGDTRLRSAVRFRPDSLESGRDSTGLPY
jgi:hypothetical protein